MTISALLNQVIKSGEERADSGGKWSSGYRDKACDVIELRLTQKPNSLRFIHLTFIVFEIPQQLWHVLAQTGNAPN
jgi:hypothetical protein